MPNDPSTAAIARLRGEFSCAATEAGFLHAHARTILRDLRRALILCSLFYVMFGVTDMLSLGLPDAIPSLLARFTVPALAYAGLRHARRAHAPATTAYRVASAFTLLAMATYMIIAWRRPADTLLHGTSVGLMAVVILVFIPNRVRTAAVIALGSSLAFVALAWCVHLESTRHLVSMTMLILFANAFGIVASNRHARLWREQYRTQQVLTNLSVRDPLTGCYNRRHLNAALLDGELARARRYRLSLSLIMCDLDGFKAINDTFGHHAGADLHLTVLSLFTVTADYAPHLARRADYAAAVRAAVDGMCAFDIDFDGIAISRGAVLARGFPRDGTLELLRERLRAALRARGLDGALDRRYRLVTAHSTLLRFIVPPAQPARLAAALAALRHTPLGTMRVERLQLVVNDWYMSSAAVEPVDTLALA